MGAHKQTRGQVLNRELPAGFHGSRPDPSYLTGYRSYIICTSPRSGSTLLCKLLAATGRSGVPESHFHDPSISDWLGYYGLRREQFTTERDALNAAFSAALKQGTGDTGLFGLRLQRHSFCFFIQQLEVLYPDRLSDTARLEAAFGKTLFIHLTREDKLEQAVSFVKARQTGLWHMAPDGTEIERLSPAEQPVYDADAIAEQLRYFNAADDDWKTWFATQQIEPLRVTYEALSADPRWQLARILACLGIKHEPDENLPLPVAKLADTTNREWTERFRRENFS